MKFLYLFFTLFLSANLSFSTEASDFISKMCSETCCSEKVKITVKKEHTEELNQTIDNEFIPKITYGYGDMKIKGCKKQRISYICLLNCSLKPFWGYVIPR